MEILRLILVEIALWGIVAILSTFPYSRASRLAFTWLGPTPRIGEARSRYRARRSLWVLILFFQSIAIFFSLELIIRSYPELQEGSVKLIAMVLPTLAILLLVTAAWYACTAAKARWFGPNPTFEASSSE